MKRSAVTLEHVKKHRYRLLEAASNGNWQALREIDLEIRVIIAELRDRRSIPQELRRAIDCLSRAHQVAMGIAKEQRYLLKHTIRETHDLKDRSQAYGNVIRANFGVKQNE
jgi:hypothetical protein